MRSRQLSQNKFLDPSTPSMRKAKSYDRKEEEKKKEWKRIVKIAVYFHCASQPPERLIFPHTGPFDPNVLNKKMLVSGFHSVVNQQNVYFIFKINSQKICHKQKEIA